MEEWKAVGSLPQLLDYCILVIGAWGGGKKGWGKEWGVVFICCLVFVV